MSRSWIPAEFKKTLAPRVHPSSRSLAVTFESSNGALFLGTLTPPITSISFDVGFDLPAGTTEFDGVAVTPPSVALLIPIIDFADFTADVARMVVLPLNGNFLVDQTISYSGPGRQFFALLFAVPLDPSAPEFDELGGFIPVGSPAIVVDNLRFETGDPATDVPMPATLPLLAGGLATLGMFLRRRG